MNDGRPALFGRKKLFTNELQQGNLVGIRFDVKDCITPTQDHVCPQIVRYKNGKDVALTLQ